MEIVYKKIDDIIPYDNNPRDNKEAVKYVAQSIKEFGFKNPIIIDKDNVIVCGHTRLKAAIELGMEEVPTIKADVSVNIYAFLKAQETGKPVELCCAIGDNTIDGKPYNEIVEIARNYIKEKGGFEKFAEWGLY